MSPRIEVDVPSEHEDKFRAFVATLIGSQITRDGPAIEARKKNKQRSVEEVDNAIIQSFLAPKEPDDQAKITEGFKAVFFEVFSPRRISTFHLTDEEDLTRARNALHDIFSQPYRSLRPLAILIERHGLANGQPKTVRETGQVFGFSGARVSQLEKKALSTISYYAKHRQELYRQKISSFVELEKDEL